LRNPKSVACLLKSVEQAIGMRSRTQRDANTSLAPVISRPVANQNASPPHLLDKGSRDPHTRQHEVRLAWPVLNPNGLESAL
jgi:hypothetical protein